MHRCSASYLLIIACFLAAVQTSKGLSVNVYNVTGGSAATCIYFQASIKFNIPFTDNKGKNMTASVDVPPQNLISYSGVCGQDSQLLQIAFNSSWSLRLSFMKDSNNSHFSYHLSNAALHYTVNGITFPNAINIGASRTVRGNFSSSILSVDTSHSYYCQSSTKLNLNNGVIIILTSLQYQAFINDTFTQFSANQKCAGDLPGRIHSRDIIAFSVGGGLAGLTLLVLILYFIGRHRVNSNNKVV